MLQRGSFSQRDRIQPPDRIAKSRWPSQPVTVIGTGKFYHPAIQSLVSEQDIQILNVVAIYAGPVVGSALDDRIWRTRIMRHDCL